MSKNIEPKLKKIGDYLKLEEDTVFTIPEYQRAYSWGIDNCDKLWQDINDFVESESKDRYFFGTIIINCQDNDTKYGLIDGQQRTTTFLLLLKALLVRINIAIERTASDEDSASLCRGLQERRRRIMGILYKAETEDISDKPDAAKDSEICHREIILENFSINEQYKTELSTILQATDYASAEARVIKIKYKQKDNRYTNFFRNFKFFYGKISELSDSQLNSIAKSITDNCEVIEIKSWQVEQAITMFNSLNSDGLPLYDSDIISAKLYAEAEKRGKEKEFADLWKKLNNCINELESTRIADINSILMQYMYYIRTVNKETISETGAINVTMVSGVISEARFQMLADSYEQEQDELREKITMLEEEIQNQEDQVENVDRFIQMAKKYLYLEKLTPAVLNDMVSAVYVHAPDKSSGYRIQDVDISYNYIGILPANLLYDIQNGETA